jgi:acyl carrier protein
MPTQRALALLTTALTVDRPVLIPIQLDLTAMRAQAAEGALSPVFRGLVRIPARRAVTGGPSVAERLAGLTDPQRDELLLDLVRTHSAAVLGHSDGIAIDPQRSFQELGFDSLTAVELRNRLNTATGLRLPATLVFDHPTATAIAQHLKENIVPDGSATAIPVLAELDRLEAAILAGSSDEGTRTRIATRLSAVLWRLNGAESAAGNTAESDEDILSATDEELFDVLDNEFGVSVPDDGRSGSGTA